jgi:aspartate aminotransferase
MTGWRIGYLGGPEWIARACNKIQGQVTSGANCIAQRAVITALNEDPKKIKYMVDEFKSRRDLILRLLSNVKGFVCNKPDGAFYVFPDISFYFNKTIDGFAINNASEMSMFLLEKAQVATVTGNAFGNPNCIRISYAASKDKIIEAIDRIKKCLS